MATSLMQPPHYSDHVNCRIAGMFGEVNVRQIAELKEIGEIKFGELIDFIHKDAMYMVWRTSDDSPNLPNFLTAKHSCYMVGQKHL